MTDAEKMIRSRRSVRTFDGRELTAEDREKLCAFTAEVGNPYAEAMEFRLLQAKEHRLSCPVAVGTELYLGAKLKKGPHHNEAFGYSFEKAALYALSLGIGTVFIGGTMNRAAFEKAMELKEDEVLPCISPLGYPASRMSLRETMMRKGVSADGRAPFEELFFCGSFASPLTPEAAGKMRLPLEMVRLAPSAVNKQPWRVLLTDSAVHFYLKRSKSLKAGTIDMQRIDMGIALCHFELTAREAGMDVRFALNRPDTETAEGEEYIASYEF